MKNTQKEKKERRPSKTTVTEVYKEDADITADDFIRTARSKVGMKYENQGRGKNSGLDCGWLLISVGHDLGVTDIEVTGYSDCPDGETFEELLDMVLSRVEDKDDVQPGDILACDYGEGIQHVAIVVERQSENQILVIHATRKSGVAEQFLTGRHRRAWVRTYRLKNLA